MLWYYEKLSEDEYKVVYAYGWNTPKATGKLMCNKKTGEYTVLHVAENDDKSGAEWALYHLYKLTKLEYPEKTIAMIG
ncbi:MAG: hypothetical protein Ta2A_10920 [Treponemataceae bacterium]|nr:MAG: hypothetical protein Ta2A_10920 [Treponemataceae bacterium]